MACPILGLCGKRRSGKDLLARRLSLRFDDVQIMKFASTLKGLTFCTTSNINAFTPSVDDDMRRMLQIFGSTIMRNHRNGVRAFVDMVDAALGAPDAQKVIITDVRYPHEAEWIRSLGGVVVKIVTNNGNNASDLDKHASEQRISEVRADLEITSSDALTDDYTRFQTNVVEPIASLTGWEVKARKPKVFVASNISGCTVDDYESTYDRIKAELENAGYIVITPADITTYEDFIDEMRAKPYPQVCAELYRKNMRAVAESDALFSYIIVPSIGVSMELLAAFIAEKPVIIVTTNQDLIYHPYLWVVSHGHIHTSVTDGVRALNKLLLVA